MGDTLRRTDEIMYVEDRAILLFLAQVHPRDFQIRRVGVIHCQMPHPVLLWSEPWFDHEHTVVIEVRSHAGYGAAQVLQCSDVPNRTEQTGDDIEGAVQLKVDHICLVERHIRASLARDLE